VNKLVLVVPGLCGPADEDPFSGLPGGPPQALEKLLGRARVDSGLARDLDACVGDLFGLSAGASGQLPVAPLTWLADTGTPAAGYLMRIDPVHLRADQSSLRLYDSHAFSIDPGEAQDLAAAFNELYRDRGWQLEPVAPTRWYLALAEPPVLETRSPAECAGRDINELLPGGAHSREWHALLNEVQMLFHAHPVNTAREQRGEPAINSIWPWGGGVQPDAVETSLASVVSDQPLVMGLAQLAGIPRRDLPADAVKLAADLGDGTHLVVIDALAAATQYADAEAWAAGLLQLETAWFRPLLERVGAGHIGELELYPVNGRRYRISRRRMRRFWIRPRSLAEHCRNG
jgi:hypothetical protein